jgi:hypothetical protein
MHIHGLIIDKGNAIAIDVREHARASPRSDIMPRKYVLLNVWFKPIVFTAFLAS